jgi:hypothetical protein
VIILSGESDRFDITSSKANKDLASFKFQIDLITHKAVQAVDLISAVHNATYSVVDPYLPVRSLRLYWRTN